MYLEGIRTPPPQETRTATANLQSASKHQFMICTCKEKNSLNSHGELKNWWAKASKGVNNQTSRLGICLDTMHAHDYARHENFVLCMFHFVLFWFLLIPFRKAQWPWLWPWQWPWRIAHLLHGQSTRPPWFWTAEIQRSMSTAQPQEYCSW